MKNQRKHLILNCANDTVKSFLYFWEWSYKCSDSWLKKFRASNINFEDEENCGHPSTTNLDITIAIVEGKQAAARFFVFKIKIVDS